MKNLLFFALTFSVLTVAFGQDGSFHLDEEYVMDPRGTIDLATSDADVFITGSPRTNARVKIDREVIVKGIYTSIANDFSVDIDVTDGGLRIRDHEASFNGGMITYLQEEYKIEIEAPEGATLVIRGDDGDYFVKNINGEISMSIDDADVELMACKGDRFSFRIDDGDLRMNEGRGSLEIHGDDADVEIYSGAFTSVNTSIDDGDLTLETALSDDGNYSLRTEDGSIHLKVLRGGGRFDIDHDDGNITLQGEFRTITEGDSHAAVALANGNARVRLRGDDANIRLSDAN